MEVVPSDQRLWSLYKWVKASIQLDLRPLQILTIKTLHLLSEVFLLVPVSPFPLWLSLWAWLLVGNTENELNTGNPWKSWLLPAQVKSFVGQTAIFFVATSPIGAWSLAQSAGKLNENSKHKQQRSCYCGMLSSWVVSCPISYAFYITLRSQCSEPCANMDGEFPDNTKV